MPRKTLNRPIDMYMLQWEVMEKVNRLYSLDFELISFIILHMIAVCNKQGTPCGQKTLFGALNDISRTRDLNKLQALIAELVERGLITRGEYKIGQLSKLAVTPLGQLVLNDFNKYHLNGKIKLA